MTAHDSSAVFYNRAEFENDRSHTTCRCRIKEKAWFLWSDFSYEARDIMSIKSKRQPRVEWQPGSIYGFYLNGIKYQYFSDLKRYVAMLAPGTPVHFYVRDKGPGWDKYSFGTIFYNTDESPALKGFSLENIRSQFSNNPALLSRLEKIRERIHQYEGGFSNRVFQKVQQFIYEEF